jgi:hypothetical protein
LKERLLDLAFNAGKPLLGTFCTLHDKGRRLRG